MIKIFNQNDIRYKYNPKYIIKIDRTSILGNPFRMSPFKNQIKERYRVCDEYELYFNNIIHRYKSNEILSEFDKAFISELYRIYIMSQKDTIYLACWCTPKRCHGETILNFINNQAEIIFRGGLRC